MSTYSGLCQARVDLEAIRNNVNILARANAGVPLLADVSADGYGHGAVPIARAAIEAGAGWLGVGSVADAALLRLAGITAPILASIPTPAYDAGSAKDLGVVLRGRSDELDALYDPGPALYGLGIECTQLGVVAAMRVSTTVIGTKTIERGDGVSYGYTFRAIETTNLAMVAMGYADGLDRCAGNVAAMELGGKSRRIAGRVAMNAAVLNLGQDSVGLGDEAVLFGAGGEPTASRWAHSVGITDVEVVTVFGRMLARSYG
ncbi:MAG: alanine racemase C-terminal domain-containing protein [Lacisediminihabitans sp.]